MSTSKPHTLASSVAETFVDEGPLAKVLPSFEPRPSQRQMAIAAADIFESGGVLLVEAGTGIGKTIAYLVPAILSRNRILISTGTKTLQDQIFYKDLPALRKALDISFTATYMKGRGNFLCLHRFDALQKNHEPFTKIERNYLDAIGEWAKQTKTGDRAEIEDLPDDFTIWHDISATTDNCIGTECPQYQDCFVTKMRQNALESDLVIVNHHLLCADTAVKHSAYGEVIPECRYVVIDEAHQVEDVATQYFGVSLSDHRLDELLRDVQRVLDAKLWTVTEITDELKECVERTRKQSQGFFDSLNLNNMTGDRVRITSDLMAPIAEPGHQLIQSLANLGRILGNIPDATEDVLALSRRSSEVCDQLRFLISASDPNFVYFFETRGRGAHLRASPIDVSEIVSELLFQKMEGTILTSATLTVDNSFDYVRKRLGINQAFELQLLSEFDFKKQAILYLPQRMPDPRSKEFVAAAAYELTNLLAVTEGRAFILCTSYNNLKKIHRLLESTIPYPLLVQGSAPRTVLLREFRSTPQAVLLATSSFWQGVDVKGKELSCVVIDKLPFASPSDPITAARMEAIESCGGNAFTDYQVPLAILTLLQGLGRLIRHRNDRGVLAILDRRLETKGYGHRFLASLPPSLVTHELSDIKRFFDGDRSLDSNGV